MKIQFIRLALASLFISYGIASASDLKPYEDKDENESPLHAHQITDNNLLASCLKDDKSREQACTVKELKISSKDEKNINNFKKFAIEILFYPYVSFYIAQSKFLNFKDQPTVSSKFLNFKNQREAPLGCYFYDNNCTLYSLLYYFDNNISETVKIKFPNYYDNLEFTFSAYSLSETQKPMNFIFVPEDFKPYRFVERLNNNTVSCCLLPHYDYRPTLFTVASPITAEFELELFKIAAGRYRLNIQFYTYRFPYINYLRLLQKRVDLLLEIK